MNKELENIRSILDLFLSPNADEVVSQEGIEWELDFRTHLLNEIQRNFISREKVEEVIEKRKKYFAATAKRYAEYAHDEETEINKKGWEKESDKNVASYNALSDLRQELLE